MIIVFGMKTFLSLIVLTSVAHHYVIIMLNMDAVGNGAGVVG